MIAPKDRPRYQRDVKKRFMLAPSESPHEGTSQNDNLSDHQEGIYNNEWESGAHHEAFMNQDVNNGEPA